MNPDLDYDLWFQAAFGEYGTTKQRQDVLKRMYTEQVTLHHPMFVARGHDQLIHQLDLVYGHVPKQCWLRNWEWDRSKKLAYAEYTISFQLEPRLWSQGTVREALQWLTTCGLQSSSWYRNVCIDCDSVKDMDQFKSRGRLSASQTLIFKGTTVLEFQNQPQSAQETDSHSTAVEVIGIQPTGTLSHGGASASASASGSGRYRISKQVDYVGTVIMGQLVIHLLAEMVDLVCVAPWLRLAHWACNTFQEGGAGDWSGGIASKWHAYWTTLSSLWSGDLSSAATGTAAAASSHMPWSWRVEQVMRTGAGHALDALDRALCSEE